MSTSDNFEEIGSALSRYLVKAQKAAAANSAGAFEDVLNEISTALSDLVSAVEDIKPGGKTDSIAASIKDLAASLAALTKKDNPVTVQNNVSPTPITVEAVLPTSPPAVVNVAPGGAPIGAEWTMKIPGTGAWPDRTVVIRRTK